MAVSHFGERVGTTFLKVGLALCIAISLEVQSCHAAQKELYTTDVSRERYEAAVVKVHASKSHLPSQGEAQMLMQLNSDLFTDDAWEGMKM